MKQKTILTAVLSALLALVAVGLVQAPAQAAAPSYVALGDSYASGTGTRSYISDGTSCQRSTFAYPKLIAAARGYALNFKACSGATDLRRHQRPALGADHRHQLRERSRSAATTPASPACSPSARSPAG